MHIVKTLLLQNSVTGYALGLSSSQVPNPGEFQFSQHCQNWLGFGGFGCPRLFVDLVIMEQETLLHSTIDKISNITHALHFFLQTFHQKCAQKTKKQLPPSNALRNWNVTFILLNVPYYECTVVVVDSDHAIYLCTNDIKTKLWD